MAKKATKSQKDALETLSYIDNLVTVLGDYPESTLPLSIDVNPFGFLINICKSLGIFDELLLFLVKIIQYELPLIELGVKGILLANLKEVVSCSSDPFIPNYMRKQISNSNTSSGITFTLGDIDYNNLLNINPLASGAEYYYLGIDRKYLAWFRIYTPKYQKELVSNETSKNYKSQDEAKNWLQKKENQLRKKYVDTNLFKYDFESDVKQEEVQITKRNKETRTEIQYYAYIQVYSTSKDSDGYEETYTDTFDTYPEAESFVVNKKLKYKRKYSKENTTVYMDFGIENKTETTPYELARAKDFNAFLWFVTHMADFNSPIMLNAGNKNAKTIAERYNEWQKAMENSLATYQVKYKPPTDEKAIEKEGPLGVLTFSQKTVDSANIPSMLGTTFRLNDSTDSAIYDLCIKSETNDKNEYSYTVVPATSDENSLNWYGDRGKYFDFLKYYASPKKEASGSPRHYYKEIGICNIEFDSTINSTAEYSNFTRNIIRFTVLPKPLTHIPQFLTKGEMPWKYKMLLFNTKGQLDSKGKFSVFVTKRVENQVPTIYPDCHDNKNGDYGISKEDYPSFYYLANKSFSKLGENYRLYIPKKWSDGIKVVVNGATGTTIPFSCLYECYPNLTVYEFNYDYIMSQRLFEPKVLAGELIESILNVKLGISGGIDLGIKHNLTEGTLRQVIIDMIEGDTDAYAVNDCYSSFSNEKYDTLLKNAELKKSQGYHFEGNGRVTQIDTEKITAILNEYDNPDITQEGQVDVLTRAFQQAMVSITAETEDTESWDIKFNFIQQLIKDLTFTIVQSLLTPKILMILAVNKQLMGTDQEWTGDVFENLLSILINIVKQIVKEIKDMILQELLSFVLGFLKPKFAELAALIIKEYTEQYRDQIKALINACGFGWGWSAATADTQLDKVTYADIDPIEEITTDNVC